MLNGTSPVRLTQGLQAHERETIRACSALRSELLGESTELIDTLLEVMTLDSQKHQRLLTALEMLLRQYFPKGTDPSVYSRADLNRLALQLNQRPRKTLGFRSPAEVFNESVALTS